MDIKKYLSLLRTPKLFLAQLRNLVLCNILRFGRFFLPDKIYLRIKYIYIGGEGHLDFKHPRTYNEKMQWIKMNDRKEIYHSMVDKVEAKSFIAEKIGPEYCIPTICIWNSISEIDLSKLPDSFIIKNTFDSGTFSLCRDKKTFCIKEAIDRLNSTRGKDYSLYSREWPYRGLKQRVLVEPLLNASDNQLLVDYKLMTFSGVPKLLFVLTERGVRETPYQDIFDMNGRLVGYNQSGYINNPETPSLPHNFILMQDLARKLSVGTFCLRVDFYEVNGRVYVGELTFFDNGGFSLFNAREIDELWGNWIHLPMD